MGTVPRGEMGTVPFDDTFWALRDASFDVQPGEVIGIIGPNGAGKSTLLKILSRVTDPTAGRAVLRGTVASLLEVGTGFHRELTGRENIQLRGALLGMKRAEIQRRFDEIVAFAGVERFIDTPVKHYSSGMYVRLAFAVAAHLQPEILIVDEVLAVGDAAFQKKCLGTMEDVARTGRTVLFVSHNMAAVKRLCTRAFLMLDGRIHEQGDVHAVVNGYERAALRSENGSAHRFPIVEPEHGLTLESVRANVIDRDGATDLDIDLHLRADPPIDRLGVGIWVYTHDGTLVSKLGPGMTNTVLDRVDGERYCTLRVPDVTRHLAGGDYTFNLYLGVPRTECLLSLERAGVFTVPPTDPYGTGRYFELDRHGIVPLPVQLEEVEAPCV